METTPCTSSSWTGSKPLTKSAWRLCKWLQRYGVPEGILNFVTNVYTSQLFQVTATGQISEILEAKSGIRQGCQLFPYLFLTVPSMTLHDVDKQLFENGGLLPWVLNQQTPFYNLAYAAYADDAALIAAQHTARSNS